MPFEVVSSEVVTGTEVSDAQLVVAALHDPERFAQLYDRYADRVFRYALSRTSSFDAAEDITSETMLAVFERLDAFDADRGAFTTWVFTIASRRIADHQRNRWRAIKHAVDTRRRRQVTADDEMFAAVARTETRICLLNAVARLPGDQRELVALRYAAELTSVEIADILGISSSAVRMRLTRVIRQLREEVAACR
ncbi:MAG: sigma-70 family RNA polymerase sigma factor [Thermomicrobiales bacterium]|nr:sigma-70 family RNA polymerase sigma factor [Thermomicrobiales bacterium]